MSASAHTVAVIGAGWAGCAAAAELASAGYRVHLFESARVLGGRARAVEINGLTLDNGQHIMLGAYTETLRLMRKLGVDPEKAFLQLPLQMRYPDGSGGMDFVAPRLPAPLHLLAALIKARGLSREDKMALARFSTTARWIEWRLNQDCTVEELLGRHDQTPRLIQLMWRPLCIAALNTPPERASAQVFLNVLRDSLGAHRAASDMLVPRVDMSALLPSPAGAYVEEHGGLVHTGCTVTRLAQDGQGWLLEWATPEPQSMHVDKVIVATQPGHAASLLQSLQEPLPTFDYEPITTCYLQYDPEISLPLPFLALIDDAVADTYGQFVFDRGQLMPEHKGLLSVVVSASAQALEQGHAALADGIARQLAQALRMPALMHPRWSKVISEKRATFSCRPALTRPDGTTAWPSLRLAGDYIAGDYPATLEGAVRSGVAAAHALMAT